MNTQQIRLEALERQIERLRRRLAILEERGNRYGWMRVGIFFGGILLSVLTYFVVGWWLCFSLAALAILIFCIVVYFHQQITRSITRHSLWMHIKTTEVARMQLDWSGIPVDPANESSAEHPFEIDLDIVGKHSLHRLLNTAATYEGSQRLLEWLRATTPDLAAIQRRQELVRELAGMPVFRDRLLMKSILIARSKTETWEGKKLLRWLEEHRNTAPLLPLLFVSLAFSVFTITLFILNLLGFLPAYWVIVLMLSILFLFNTKKQRGDLFEDAHYLNDAFARLSTVFAFLEGYRYGAHGSVKSLCAPFFTRQEQRPSRLLNSIARIAWAATLQKNMLVWVIVNALVPWDFYIAYRFHHDKERIAGRLPCWLDTWFELEALNSLAAFAYLNPDYTLPEMAVASQENRSVFQARDLGHPLIPRAQKVVNDFSMRAGEIDIITGSNMSGKSTFLRTLGINLCLAYAGGPVNASLFSTGLFRLYSCIRVSDSVTEGFSYFYAEVKRLRALLDELGMDSSLPLFILIDEIFKGTNNRERLIGSESYISALVGKNCLGAISTHDLELVKLADRLSDIRNYHFREEVINGQMVFDYILREGPCPTTNALKIMRMEGLPVDMNLLSERG